MRNPNTRFIWVSLTMLAVMAGLVLPSTVNGQSGNRNQAPPVPGSPRPGDELRPESIRARQFKMMEMEREAAAQPLSPEEEKLAAAEIAEDYKQIQIVNNKMMSAAMPAASPNFVNIGQALTEIRKRAARLRDNLGLSKPELKEAWKGKHRKALNVADVKSDLLSLDSVIMSFVKNSIFRNTEVVNVEEATKARRDLEFIIENSQLIIKDVERLNKSSEKAP
ncbi:MAG: hypothetical protein AABN95_12895 [Acidobacteriota bacterium]